jgi:hypothetical protein
VVDPPNGSDLAVPFTMNGTADTVILQHYRQSLEANRHTMEMMNDMRVSLVYHKLLTLARNHQIAN